MNAINCITFHLVNKWMQHGNGVLIALNVPFCWLVSLVGKKIILDLYWIFLWSFVFNGLCLINVTIRSFQIKRDWFRKLYCKNSYLEIRKTNFYVLYVKKFTKFSSFRICICFLQKQIFFISFDGVKLKKITFF